VIWDLVLALRFGLGLGHKNWDRFGWVEDTMHVREIGLGASEGILILWNRGKCMDRPSMIRH
jgi:hypothetical protein